MNMRLDTLSKGPSEFHPTADDLEAFYFQKYGGPENAGWSPQTRHRFGYYLPGDIYEALVAKMVNTSTEWIDVGGGDSIFPHNSDLSKELALRAERLVAVDPSENVLRNPYAHEKVQGLIEDYSGSGSFDLATFRMVVEHVMDPAAVLTKLAGIVRPGGYVVIYTVHKYCPIPVIAGLTPFALHFKITRHFAGQEERNLFPVAYKMNTRGTLCSLFKQFGFKECHFSRLDDISTTINYRRAHLADNWARHWLNRAGIAYPEFNLLGIYRRESSSDSIELDNKAHS